jgi:hypothetical protein
MFRPLTVKTGCSLAWFVALTVAAVFAGPTAVAGIAEPAGVAVLTGLIVLEGLTA